MYGFEAVIIALALGHDWIGVEPVQHDWIGTTIVRAELAILEVYAPSWCSGCPAKVADIQSMVGFDVRVHDNSREFPGWTQNVGGVYPIIAWQGHDKPYYVADYTTTTDLRKRWGKTQKTKVGLATLDDGQQPTPIAEIRRVLALLRPQSHETFIDYGCGDGRWLIEAARAYGCRAVGVEIDQEQAARARQAVADAGLAGRVQIIEGDVMAVNVDAHVGVAYLYPDVLAQLKTKLLRLNRFATYMHGIDGVAMRQNGDAWIWERPVPVMVQQPVQQRYAYYGGQAYSGRVCSNPRCSMCNQIARQLGF